MDWQRYKAICDSPDVCSRWLLEQTLELLGGAAPAEQLRAALGQPPIDRPADHRGPPQTDMLPLSLTLVEATCVRRVVERAAARGVTTAATRERGLGGFVAAWREYEQFLQHRAGG